MKAKILVAVAAFYFLNPVLFGEAESDMRSAVQTGIRAFKEVNRKTIQTCPQENNDIDEANIWQERGFEEVEVTNFITDDFYNNSSTNFTHAMDLTMVTLRNAGWDKDIVQQTIQRVAEVYEQCGIKVRTAKYVEVNAPRNIVDVSYRENDDTRLARMTPPDNQPTLFFVRSNVEGNTAYAWNEASVGPPRSNTAIITSQVNTSGYKEIRTPGYSPTAHELAHLFCNCSHRSDETPNILAGNAYLVNSNITQEQCATFKNSSLVKEL